jgi:hypothetical protein
METELLYIGAGKESEFLETPLESESNRLRKMKMQWNRNRLSEWNFGNTAFTPKTNMEGNFIYLKL